MSGKNLPITAMKNEVIGSSLFAGSACVVRSQFRVRVQKE